MSTPVTPSPPVAPQEPHEHSTHGVVRADPYHWMRRTDAALLDHLAAERAWYDAATARLGPLVTTLRSQMLGRLPATDASVSWRRHGYSYRTVVPADREYAQLSRGRDDEPTEVLLDVNELTGGSAYVELGLSIVSPDGATLAWSVDRDGDEVYELRFRDLVTGHDLDDVVPRSYYGGAWSADSRSFLYTVHDDAYRPWQVWRHQLGSEYDADELVLEERDERFELMVRGTRSGGLVVVWAESRDTSEVWVLDASRPDAVARSVGGRRRGVTYHAEHVALPTGGDQLVMVTDDGHTEFRLMGCPVPRDADQDASAWTSLRAPDAGERLERAEAFAGHVVLVSRVDGHERLRVLPLTALDGPGLVVDPLTPTGTVALARHEEFDVDAITVRDESWLTPPVWSDVDLTTGARTERHRHQAQGHDPSAYVEERLAFPAPDGHRVPATVMRHRDTPLDGTAPCLLYGYGAYESVFEPEWDVAVPALLDRGVVLVHTHLRGGGEGGRTGYLDGRLAHKQHTFDDHLAVADGLAGTTTGRPLVDGDRIATRGLSAGGLLQGAVLSQRPERWRAVVAEVPFVDVVTTMLDASIPLTVNEWDEWGDPSRPADFAWMLAYSPYDNLPPAGARPDLLVTGAVHDARVMVFEPAKWVAALRHTDPGWSPRCLFRVETGAGAHAGPSGRFAHLAYEAEVLAWVLDRLDVGDGAKPVAGS